MSYLTTLLQAVMCLAIACGLPADAGGAKDLRPTVCVYGPVCLIPPPPPSHSLSNTLPSH